MTAPAKRAPLFFVVPAGTRQATCRGCEAPIFWIITAAGKRMPVDCNVDGGVAPFNDATKAGDPVFDGTGVSHFITCSEAPRFRRSR